MKLAVQFADEKQLFAVRMSEDEMTIKPDMGETTVLHDGQNGATFFPSVSADGIISWTNDRDLPNPAPVNIKGADGKDGIDGAKGEKGDPGKDGVNGQPGQDGYTPIKGVDYFDGTPGKDGTNGKDGYTPVKGTDYFTEADKAEMVAAVIAALPVYGGEYA